MDSEPLCTLVPSLLAPTSGTTAWLLVHIVVEQIASVPSTDSSVEHADMLPANILSVFVLQIQVPCTHVGPLGWCELVSMTVCFSHYDLKQSGWIAKLTTELRLAYVECKLIPGVN